MGLSIERRMRGAIDRSNRMCVTMFQFLKERRLCDVAIQVQNEYHPCHKIVLAAASPLLKAIINENAKASDGVSELILRIDFFTSCGKSIK